MSTEHASAAAEQGAAAQLPPTFQDPEIPGRVLIKRCIAVGGQTVDINDEDGLVYVDGVALREPYTAACPRTRLPATSPTPTRCPKA